MAECNIQYLTDKRMLHVKWSGTYTAEDSKRMAAKIAAMDLEPEKVAILIDHRDTNIKMTLSEIYRFPENYKNVVGAPLFVVAVVFKQIGLTERFFKAISAAAGFSGLQIFSDYAQAKGWLEFRQRTAPI